MNDHPIEQVNHAQESFDVPAIESMTEAENRAAIEAAFETCGVPNVFGSASELGRVPCVGDEPKASNAIVADDDHVTDEDPLEYLRAIGAYDDDWNRRTDPPRGRGSRGPRKVSRKIKATDSPKSEAATDDLGAFLRTL